MGQPLKSFILQNITKIREGKYLPSGIWMKIELSSLNLAKKWWFGLIIFGRKCKWERGTRETKFSGFVEKENSVLLYLIQKFNELNNNFPFVTCFKCQNSDSCTSSRFNNVSDWLRVLFCKNVQHESCRSRSELSDHIKFEKNRLRMKKLGPNY